MADALGELQLQVMDVVWRLEEATVAQVHQELARSRRIAYTTVLTTMRNLERRGVLIHQQVGKAYVYRSRVTRQEYTDSSVRKLVGELFGGRQERLLCHLLGAERIGPAELARIRRTLHEKEGKP